MAAERRYERRWPRRFVGLGLLVWSLSGQLAWAQSGRTGTEDAVVDDAEEIQELEDAEARRAAEKARIEAERKRVEAEQTRLEKERAADAVERVEQLNEQLESEVTEHPSRRARERQRVLEQTEETTRSEAADAAQQAREADVEYREAQAEAEILEKAADPETGRVFRRILDRRGPILGIRFTGEIFADGAKFDEPLAGSDGAEIRRARIGLYKGFNARWYAKANLEVSSGNVEYRDTYLGYSGWATGFARAGMFAEPFGQESTTGARFTTFLEESLPVEALAPGTSFGFSALKRTEEGIMSGGLFLWQPDQEGLGEAGQAVTARWVRSPVWAPEEHNAHMGVSMSYRINADPDDTRFRTRPESALSGPRLVDTGEIESAHQLARLGLELSKLWGPLSLQTEFMGVAVDRTDDRETLVFTGVYMFGSWFVTGESRNFLDNEGAYGRIAPLSSLGSGGYGALELAARVSHVDLSDRDVTGGKETNLTIGLNWYPQDDWRFMFNAIKVLDVDRPGTEFDGINPWIVTLRGQWEWR